MFNPACIVRPHVQEMPAYEPILPFEVLSRQLGRSADQIIKLDANENPYGPLPEIREALGCLPYAHIYPDPGSQDLRSALADHYQVPVENLLAGAGADELIDLVMRLFLDPGDRILNCPPTFGMYSFDADLNRARIVSIPRLEDFSLDMPAIEAAIQQYQPKLLFLASPNNPDGSMIPSGIIRKLLAFPLVLVLDEAYIEFAPFGMSMFTDALHHANLIVLRTFSKWAGLAGLRVGYGVFPSQIMPQLWKIKQPYTVSVAASTAAILSLAHIQALSVTGERIMAERQRMFEMLSAFAWIHPYPSQANFILCRVSGRDAGVLKNQLAQAGILVRYFNKPGLQNCVRISVGKPEHTDALIRVLCQLEKENTLI
jgi:histidinol-phosphate aminotransferase